MCNMYIKRISLKITAALFISLTCCKTGYSNGYVSWKKAGTNAIQRVSVVTGENIVFYENHIDTLQQYTLDYEMYQNELHIKGHLFSTQGGLKAVFPGTGKVFQLDTIAGIVTRVDETYHHGYNFDSYQFVRKDTVYSFGGYGFWMQNNLLTFFSDVRNEWSLYSRAPMDVSVPELDSRAFQIANYDKVNDVLFILCLGNVYGFQFESRTWKIYGLVNEEFNGEIRYMVHPLSDSTCMLMGGSKTYWLYPAGNEVADITMTNGANISGNNAPLGFACAYRIQNGLLVPKHSDKVALGYYFDYVEPRRPVAKSIQPLYIEDNGGYENLLFASFGLFSLLGILATVVLRRRYLKRRGAIFDTMQWEVLERSSNAAISTEDFNDLLGLHEVSWEVQRRKRSEFIKELNATAIRQLGQEVLLRERSEEDKRQVLYVLNPRLESALARLL
jgi:hypothetical protein